MEHFACAAALAAATQAGLGALDARWSLTPPLGKPPPLLGLVGGAVGVGVENPLPATALMGEGDRRLLGCSSKLAAMAASMSSCSFLRLSSSWSAVPRLAAIAASIASRSAAEDLLARVREGLGSSTGSWSAAIRCVQKTVAIKEYKNILYMG
jgi:hypothetical protein